MVIRIWFIVVMNAVTVTAVINIQAQKQNQKRIYRKS
jgi:hypothetical protein